MPGQQERLTPRELQAVELQLDGLTYKQIAMRLGIAHSTVRVHLANARHKLRLTGSGGTHRVVLRLQELGHLARPLPPPPPPVPEDPLTPGQRLYLDAFDRFLAARHNPDRQAAARGEMTHMLGTMCIERQIPQPAGGIQRSGPIGALLAVLDQPG